ncbi:sex peptide receptor-like [Paramacrobiotus metropolitanus]|uniref:sex peptide receptor-like n=1 Tax=Paramacrobiotus metropolitanus TaxID=2943436 RepID=UPI0024460754|nr:sex peptide receptor-like [Paramacrobiotus metropolitanus]XP_055351652.1 sex peptide receptor-like [Paramacrobiotus metropolitanus]XP_055351653.1 sex peptide receptor-like [Paramacrobiotus metropolitanus]XP_055351654.1 sex peptide receptor-like [Paramacrobiotus metropolitanus]XP_055351655.1 sex peptide receptor-like [Paramacrobiotus metropolitanus]
MSTLLRMNNSSPIILSSCGWPLEVIPKTNTGRHVIRYLDLYTYPILLMAATIGNLMNMIILKRERPNGTKNVYLITIAASDMIFMWSGLFSYISNFDGEIHGHPRPEIQTMLGRVRGVGYFFQESAAIVSSWLIIAFSAERFLAIKYPLQHKVNDHLRQCRISISGTIMAAILLATHRLVDYYWFYINYRGTGSAPNRPDFLSYWNKVYTWGIALLQMITFLIILILNAMLLREILKMRRFQQKELLAYADRSEIPTRPENNALILLGGVVILFLITQMPVFAYNIIHLLEKSCVRPVPVSVKRLAAPVLNFLLNVNYSCNFLVYCSVDRRFRQSVYYICRMQQRNGMKTGQPLDPDGSRRHSRLSDKSTAPLFLTPRADIYGAFEHEPDEA